uniref:Copine Va n=1 Tax=Acanthochromis polyacanthus TaxID=80966 RepID=A0A3Q1G843_9TELE
AYKCRRIKCSIPATRASYSCHLLLQYHTSSLRTVGAAHAEIWTFFGRTEVIDNTLNPDFVRKYILDYFFEEKQNLRFDDFLGQVYCTLGEIVGSPASRLEKPLGGIPGKKCGTIILSAEELGNCRDYATMQFCANKLDKKDFFGKSDPFMVFYRSNEDGTFTICHKTEVVKSTLNPVWQPFSIPVRALCNGDYERTIKVEVYDWDRDGSHDFIGEFTTSYKELCRGQSQLNVYEWGPFFPPQVSLLSFIVEQEHTFLDYIKGGLTPLVLKGNPSQSTSLHYMNPYQMNAYAMALKAVGEIIQDYDSDKMFPALGFGAKLPPDGRVSHEFPLNGNVENPYCNGMEGILEAYHQSLKTVQLYGPTNFAPVVNHVARYAAAVQDGSQYFVLLIITDGVISDMAQTKEAIVNAAKLPMSIIIVGVGQAEFDAMVELDGDDIRISSRGKLAERDIVQFVPFRDYMDRTGNHVLSMARLAKDVLAEIPDQLISYMKSKTIKPNPVPPVYSPPDDPQTNPV